MFTRTLRLKNAHSFEPKTKFRCSFKKNACNAVILSSTVIKHSNRAVQLSNAIKQCIEQAIKQAIKQANMQ